MSNPLAFIVEDDPDSAKLYRRMVTPAGFVCEVFSTGEAALKRLDEVTPKLVVLDLLLDEGVLNVSGLDVLEKIHNDHRLTETRVIVITGFRQMADKLENQVDHVLIKPIDVKQLRDLAGETI
ncbi:MAG: response regulator [Chloroflexi bacterium]|nr:response regulator [Chloroflexota bacterium]